MALQDKNFVSITIRPQWPQYIINEGGRFVLSGICFLLTGHELLPFKAPLLILATALLLMALYGCLLLKKLRFIITPEQLIIEHGVFHRKSDYIELYRIIDFYENRSIMEQMFGLKTVSLFSGDRTHPRLDIYGVGENMDIVGIIRQRVEYNKIKKCVYEITNR